MDTSTDGSYQAPEAQPLPGNAGDNVPRGSQQVDTSMENPATPTAPRLGSPIEFSDKDVRNHFSPKTHETVFRILSSLRRKSQQLHWENHQRVDFLTYLKNTKGSLEQRLWAFRVELAGPPPYKPKLGAHLRNGQGHGMSPPRPTLDIVADVASASIDSHRVRGLNETGTANREIIAGDRERSRPHPKLRKHKGRVEHHVAERRLFEDVRTHNTSTQKEDEAEIEVEVEEEPKLFSRPKGRIEQYIAKEKRALEASIWAEETEAVKLEGEMAEVRRELESTQEKYKKVLELLDA